MSTLRRYTATEDKKILRQWWDPRNRDKLSDDLERTKASMNFRYYSLLRKLGIDPAQHRVNQGMIPDDFKPAETQEDIESTLSDKLEELEDEISNIHKKISNIEQIVTRNEIVNTVDSENKLVAIYEEYRIQVEKNKKMYTELDYWLGQFFKLNNLEKLSTLGDFLPKIRSIIEEYKQEQIEDGKAIRVDIQELKK